MMPSNVKPTGLGTTGNAYPFQHAPRGYEETLHFIRKRLADPIPEGNSGQVVLVKLDREAVEWLLAFLAGVSFPDNVKTR